MKTVIYSDIYDYCRWNKAKNISDILNSNMDLNLLYKEGIYFKFAFKHNNSDMLNILLSHYYTQHKLDEPIQDYNLEQKKSKQALLQILEECTEAYDLSKKITEVLKKYTIDLSNDNSDIDEPEENSGSIIVSEEHNSLSTTHHNSPEENEYSKVLYDIINHPDVKINDAEVKFIGQDSSDYNKPDVSTFENQSL